MSARVYALHSVGPQLLFFPRVLEFRIIRTPVGVEKSGLSKFVRCIEALMVVPHIEVQQTVLYVRVFDAFPQT